MLKSFTFGDFRRFLQHIYDGGWRMVEGEEWLSATVSIKEDDGTEAEAKIWECSESRQLGLDYGAYEAVARRRGSVKLGGGKKDSDK